MDKFLVHGESPLEIEQWKGAHMRMDNAGVGVNDCADHCDCSFPNYLMRGLNMHKSACPTFLLDTERNSALKPLPALELAKVASLTALLAVL